MEKVEEETSEDEISTHIATPKLEAKATKDVKISQSSCVRAPAKTIESADLGQKQDSGPSLTQTSTHPLQTSDSKKSLTKSISDDEIDGRKVGRWSPSAFYPTYLVMYLGCTALDRRCPPQSIMPWLMAEVRRSRDAIREVTIQILSHCIRATCNDSGETEVVFEHKLLCLSRFAKTHHDPRCFAYLRRENLYSDFECHVFLAHDEKMVPEIFKCIRDATQRDISEDMSDHGASEPAKAFYEVMYVGRAKVRAKKITSGYIDDLVTRLAAKEEEMKLRRAVDKDRKRNASGNSVKSLPGNLDDNVHVAENDLQSQLHKLGGSGLDIHLDSPTSSTDELSDHHGDQQTDHHSDQQTDHHSDHNSDHNSHSSCENLTHEGSSGGLSHSGSGDHLKEVLSDLHEQNCANGGAGRQSPSLHVTHVKHETNRIMLFRIGLRDIALISPDSKAVAVDKKFKDIASVSQGCVKSDVFGFVSREPGNVFICHLLRCHSGGVVDEIMLALRTAFQSAYEQSKLQHNQICIACPLHQYHKLCQEINGMVPQMAYDLLCTRIQNLQEKEATDLYNFLKTENPQSHEESVEVLMIALRKLCESKQQEHSHISSSGRSAKSEFNLLETRHKSTGSAFDVLTKKARKKLTNSFENFLSKAHEKKDEVVEAFRHRSGTIDSEVSHDSSNPNTPDESPAPSPAHHTKDTNFTFPTPSPPHSPTAVRRPRSSTVGAIPDAHLAAKYSSVKHLEDKDQAPRRSSSAAQSPMKHMFILASNSKPERQSPTPHDKTDDYLTPPTQAQLMRRRGSWRQAIFNRVVTPSRHPDTPTLQGDIPPERRHVRFNIDTPTKTETRKIDADEQPERDLDGSYLSTKKTSEELRALWKKAIMETLLLIRMERENQDLRARQDEMHLKRQKLDYQEITPCLKEVTKTWDEMLLTPNRTSVSFDPQKLLECVKQGVPQYKRGDIWWFLVEQHRQKYSAVEEEVPHSDYTDLLKQLTTHQHAILIDLGRTFPGHPYFSLQLGPGQLALFNLLKAYSLMDQDVGYCQGLSFVAGILLMHMEELQAFEAWKHVMYNLGLRKQYRPNMIALQIQLYQLTRLLHDNYKDLYDHFENHEIAPTLYAAPWFLTLFASQFPLGFVARVFDLLFIQGIDVIFKVALVLLGNHKELIMQCDSFETVVEFIKTTLPEMGMIQMERVINQVFDMDISKQLQSYEVEYHVLKEEMMFSPQKGEADLIQKLEQANHNLKQQNMELIEKLQHANSHLRSLESTLHNYQSSENKLKSHIRTLEIERQALLNAVAKLKNLVPEADQDSLDLSLPAMLPSLPPSPVHLPPGGAGVAEKSSGAETESANRSSMSCKFDLSKSARYHPT